ncbi:MAG TPA: SOS response-associated peptidase, partial [Solirubrobacteraceae bacterium]|nr:SOS response-associated peptidase [Solirubrobacteraceae bacterium]
PAALEQRFGVAVPFSEGSRRYNIAPTETVVAIVLAKDGEPVARALRWGLIPPWAKEAKIAHKMINARSETADRKPAYRGLLATATRRALLPADGFYEWLRPEDRKQPRIPFRFSRTDGSLFAIAGLWTPGYLPAATPGEEGELVASVTILTTESNSVVARLHDRMPVILRDRDSELAWLSPELDIAGAKALCQPLSSDLLVAAPANPSLNKTSRDAVEGPELLVAQHLQRASS